MAVPSTSGQNQRFSGSRCKILASKQLQRFLIVVKENRLGRVGAIVGDMDGPRRKIQKRCPTAFVHTCRLARADKFGRPTLCESNKCVPRFRPASLPNAALPPVEKPSVRATSGRCLHAALPDIRSSRLRVVAWQTSCHHGPNLANARKAKHSASAP